MNNIFTHVARILGVKNKALGDDVTDEELLIALSHGEHMTPCDVEVIRHVMRRAMAKALKKVNEENLPLPTPEETMHEEQTFLMKRFTKVM